MKLSISGTGLIGIGIGILGVIYTAYENHKLREANVETSKKLDMTIDDVGRKSNVEIEQSIVDRAVERTVEHQVRKAVDESARLVREDIRKDIDKAVRKEVEDQYKQISEEVSERVSDIVGTINESAFKEKVMKKAEEKMLRKFDGSLDTLLNDANSKLSRELGSMITAYNGVRSLINNANSSNGRSINLNL